MRFLQPYIHPQFLEHIIKLGYTTPTPIQKEALPALLEKNDIIAQAQTGSGKTATFGIGVLHHTDVKRFRVQALIIAPTRELAQQITQTLQQLAKYQHNYKILLLNGGDSFYRQEKSLSHHAHIIVGTPGRVLKHLDKGNLCLDELKTLVLDEADKMIDMGFFDEVDAIVQYTPQTRQTLLFSATYTPQLEDLAQKMTRNGIHIVAQEVQKPDITQYSVITTQKEQTLLDTLATLQPSRAIVFTNTKVQTAQLETFLQEHGVDALALHGDLEHFDRQDVFVQLQNGSLRVLVATDIAARGLDISNLPVVINYDFAESTQTYTHRIGRTARAGESGVAVTFFEDQASLQTCTYASDLQPLQLQHATQTFTLSAPNVTIVVHGGKKQKLRAGDIVGALIHEIGLQGGDIGDISIYPTHTYVAIQKEVCKEKLMHLDTIVIKSKRYRIDTLI